MIKAVIFDMDGVIVDNGVFHKKAWTEFCHAYKINLTKVQWKRAWGRTNKATLEFMFNKKFTKKELNKLAEEKEEIYRKIYAPYIKPVKGLLNFLKELQKSNAKIALATSANTKNVEFVLGKTKTKKFFKTIVDDSMVKNGKPNPEVYLKTAKKLKINPKECVVFEDSLSGITAAKSAGMKCIGIMTSYSRQQMKSVELAVKDFTEIDLKKILNW